MTTKTTILSLFTIALMVPSGISSPTLSGDLEMDTQTLLHRVQSLSSDPEQELTGPIQEIVRELFEDYGGVLCVLGGYIGVPSVADAHAWATANLQTLASDQMATAILVPTFESVESGTHGLHEAGFKFITVQARPNGSCSLTNDPGSNPYLEFVPAEGPQMFGGMDGHAWKYWVMS